MQTEDLCPGTTDFKAIKEKKLAGCPGKKAVTRAAELVRRGADTIAFASCITKGNPIGFPCPHAEMIKAAVIEKIGTEITVLDYTH